jgi:hypothetical protein
MAIAASKRKAKSLKIIAPTRKIFEFQTQLDPHQTQNDSPPCTYASASVSTLMLLIFLHRESCNVFRTLWTVREVDLNGGIIQLFDAGAASR